MRTLRAMVAAAVVLGAAAACQDVPNPVWGYTCAQQKGWGKCGESWMVGWCCQTCFDCKPGCGAGPTPPPAPKPYPTAPPAPLSDPDASASAQLLATDLHKLAATPNHVFGHHITNFAGQTWQDPTGKQNRSDVISATGSWPMMVGYNFDWVANPGYNYKPNISGLVRAAMDRGLLLHFYWQSRNPVTGGSAYDLSGRPIENILPGGNASSTWMLWMDRVVEFVKGTLGGYPFVFRPFHEMNGDWFWWGHPNVSPEEYRRAWNYTVNYLRSKGVHNFLLAYAPSKPSGSLADWNLTYGSEGPDSTYPGDDMVDIACFDHYKDPFSGQGLLEDCERVVGLVAGKKGKIPAICEWGVSGGLTKSHDPQLFTQQFLDPVVNSSWCSRASFAFTWANWGPTQYYVPLKGEEAYSSFVEYTTDSHVLMGPSGE